MNRSSETCRICGVRRPTADGSVPCDLCGFVYLGRGGAGHFDYQVEYDETSSYNAQLPAQVLEHYRSAPNTRWALAHLVRLQREASFRTLFEFGASQGAFLALARDAGYRVKGVELAKASIEYAHTRLGLAAELEEGVWRARRDDEPCVDAVCAFEVLEHSEDPIAFLRQMRSWLRPGGVALISVPNGRRLSVRLGRREVQDLPPHHLMYWTSKALTLALEREGFEPLELRTSPVTHSDLLNLAAPNLAARRAVDSAVHRPVGAPTATRGLSAPVKLIYPVFTAAGRLLARTLDAVPELGQRLMVLARA